MTQSSNLKNTAATLPVQNVNAKWLNLRDEPLVKPSTLITSLPFGQPVEVLGPSTRQGWVEVRTTLNGVQVRGHVAAAYLRDPLSEQIEAAVAIAAAEWERFGRGRGREHVAPFAGYVGEYWAEIGYTYTGADRNVPWSAAFISFVFSRAGYTGMRFAAAHARYINEAIVARETGDTSRDFHGYRLSERRPQIGDLIARRRTSAAIDYDYAAQHDAFKSHTDMVIAVGNGYVDAIGGNLAHSVRTQRYRTDAAGYLDADGGRVFALLANRR
ncbi:MAG: DUF2272 domain-containing protein [Pseudomonadota bacterium]